MNGKRRELFNNMPYMRAWEERHVVGGDGARFTYVEVGACVSVIPIRRGGDGNIEITLIREERVETSIRILKAPGGYLKGREREEAAHQILRAEASIQCDRLHLLTPRMEGFTVILLPIATFLALDCEVVGESATQRVTMSLDEAVDFVLRQEIPDQCNADAIMRIALLEVRGRLPL